MKKLLALIGAGAALLLPAAAGAAPTGDVRVTDHTYTSSGTPGYTDSILQACSVSRGRKNEPTVAIDPRNPNVVLGSSNDYCGVYQDVDGVPQPIGPIWLGYYRSTDGGAAGRSTRWCRATQATRPGGAEEPGAYRWRQ